MPKVKTDFGLKMRQAMLSPFLVQASQPRFLVQGEVLNYSTDVVADNCEATEADRVALRQHWEMFESLFNDFFSTHKQFGALRVDTSELRKMPLQGTPDILRVWLKRNQVFASKSGILYENHLRLLFDVFLRLTEDGRSITIQGAQQSGKTTANVSMMLLGPMMFMHTITLPNPVLYCPLLLVPNRDSLYEEAKEAVLTFFTLYGLIDFRANGSRFVMPREYFSRNWLWKATDGALVTNLSAFEHSIIKRNRGDVVVTADVPLKVAKRSRGMAEAEQFLHHIIQKGVEPLIIIDETQHGAQRDSVIGKFLQKEYEEYNNVKLIQHCKSAKTLARIINVSATTYPCIGRSADVHKLFLPLNHGYHGWNFFNGKPLDESVKNTEPVIRSFSDVDKLCGTHLFAYMDAKSYVSASQYHSQLIQGRRDYDSRHNVILHRGRLEELEYSHRDYRELFEENLTKFINKCTADGDDVAIRLINSNTLSEVIVNRIRECVAPIPCVIWNADAQNQKQLRKTVAATIEFHRRQNGGHCPVALFVTGRARMGDPFPASVRHFLEFVRCTSSHVSLEQGFFGRACGYNKFDKQRVIGNFVYFNDEEVERVRDYVASQGDWATLDKPLMPKVRKIRTDGRTDLRVKGSYPEYICLEPDTPELKRWFTAIEKIGLALAKPPLHTLYGKDAVLQHFKQTGNSKLDTLLRPRGKGSARYLPIFATGNIPMPDGSEQNIDWGKHASLPEYLTAHPEVCEMAYGAANPQVTSNWAKPNGWARTEMLFDYIVTDITKDENGATRHPNRHLILKKGCLRSMPNGQKSITIAILRMVRVDADGALVVHRSPNESWGKEKHAKSIKANVVLDPNHRWKLFQVILHCNPPAVEDLPRGTVDAQADTDGTWQGVFTETPEVGDEQ